eukprot:TRINITY_DN28472_c0_g1_i1.p1 TRINITY_DN28472_c0_g1~~TRINITY_DN28472_c0_g1_i1.p1  ORF type:complete len:348 (-),score=80.15 TRINITY_DN28472_c0_g1_i1:42-1085(-)
MMASRQTPAFVAPTGSLPSAINVQPKKATYASANLARVEAGDAGRRRRPDPASRTTAAVVAAATASTCALVAGRRHKRVRLPARRQRAGISAAAAVEDAEVISEQVAADLSGTETAAQAAAASAKLLRLAAATDRGQVGSAADREECLRLVRDLESLNPTMAPARSPLLEGKWQLVFSSEDPTRCSPFFWAMRQYLEGIEDPTPISQTIFGTTELVEATYAITDAIPLKKVGLATQRLDEGQLVNQVAVGVVVTGVSQMTTTCRYVPDAANDSVLLVTVEQTQVLGDSLAARLSDQFGFPTEQVIGSESAEVRMRVTYLDDSLRIVRDERRPDDCFVFSRLPAGVTV